WQRDRGEGVAQGDAGMGVAGGIEDDERDAFLPGPVNPLDEFALKVALEAEDLGAGRAPCAGQPFVDLGERFLPVDVRLACAEEVEVRPVQYEELGFGGFLYFGHFSPK